MLTSGQSPSDGQASPLCCDIRILVAGTSQLSVDGILAQVPFYFLDIRGRKPLEIRIRKRREPWKGVRRPDQPMLDRPSGSQAAFTILQS